MEKNSGKRGRKCSVRYCRSYQHTHKHLSFFRFPKDRNRCVEWIENSKRPELMDKINVHEERVCERHFVDDMFVNEYHSRLHQTAVPVLNLSEECSPIVEFPVTFHKQNNKTVNEGPTDRQNQLNSLVIQSPSSDFNASATKLLASTPKSANNNETPSSSSFLINPNYKRARQIFTYSQEEQLAVHVRDTATYYSGLSSKEVRILAFVYGVCNQVEMPVGWRETHQASFDWCLGFIKRNKLAAMILTSHAYKNINNTNNSSKSQSAIEIATPTNLENGNVQKSNVSATIEIDD